MTTEDTRSLTLGSHDEPQHSGAIVAVHYGDYRCVEYWVRSGSNIGNWYCLGGEFGRPKPWTDPRGPLELMIDRDREELQFAPGPDEVPLHPHWEDVLARGPVTLLVPGDRDAYRGGWRNGRRRMVEQMETVADDDE